MKKRNRLNETAAAFFFLLAALTLFSGCSEQQAPVPEISSFASGAQELESLYAEAGLSSADIGRIDSKELFDESEIAALDSKLSALKPKIEGFMLKAATVKDQKERDALLALALLETARADYLDTMAALKDSAKFRKAVEEFESFDFNAVDAFDGNAECPPIQRDLEEKYNAARTAAQNLESQAGFFKENYPEFTQAAKLNEKSPRLAATGIPAFAEAVGLMSEGCTILKESGRLLAGIEQAAGSANVCLEIKPLAEKTNEFESLALRFDSFSGKAESIGELSLGKEALESQRQSLLSVADELKGIELQIESECK
ncbi:MAG: hypothetical protein NT067_05890 [Candidatus Diapherotrites archaeon]|nr:hypothetical protein [Candidatus Diapherotrites archaeon]